MNDNSAEEKRESCDWVKVLNGSYIYRGSLDFLEVFEDCEVNNVPRETSPRTIKEIIKLEDEI
jgi:hypothetical protein